MRLAVLLIALVSLAFAGCTDNPDPDGGAAANYGFGGEFAEGASADDMAALEAFAEENGGTYHYFDALEMWLIDELSQADCPGVYTAAGELDNVILIDEECVDQEVTTQ